jgi:hypothetical protein
MLNILKKGRNERNKILASAFCTATRYHILSNLKLFGNVRDISFVICCFVRVWK